MALHKPGPVSGGKVVADNLYLRIESILELGNTAEEVELQERLSSAVEIVDVRWGVDFNIVRFDASCQGRATALPGAAFGLGSDRSSA